MKLNKNEHVLTVKDYFTAVVYKKRGYLEQIKLYWHWFTLLNY